MKTPLTRRLALVGLASLLALGLSTAALAKEKRFATDDASKEKDEPATWLKDYDKLVEGKEADWVFFEGYDPKAYKTVKTSAFAAGKDEMNVKHAADYTLEYLNQWIGKSKLGWSVVKDGKADLTIEGNVVHAWEPSGAARFWGGWYANPGVVQELVGKDASGRTVFEIRHKSKGSSLKDAVENGLENVVKTLEKGK